MTDKRYTVIIMREAEKGLRKIHRGDLKRIQEIIFSLAGDPRPQGAEPFRSIENAYRIRFKVWRIVYRIVEEELVVLVVRAGHRREVYKDF